MNFIAVTILFILPFLCIFAMDVLENIKKKVPGAFSGAWQLNITLRLNFFEQFVLPQMMQRG